MKCGKLKWMKKISLLLILIVSIMALNLQVLAFDQPLFSQFIGHSFQVDYHKFEPRNPHCQLSVVIENDPKQDGQYVITQKGTGAIDEFSSASWTTRSWCRLSEGFLQTHTSETEIFDESGQPLKKYQKKYDYQDKIIIWSVEEFPSGKTTRKAFPLKGQTCDNTTLIFFVHSFIPHEHHRNQQAFYLLTDEPKMYKVNLRFLKKEKIQLSRKIWEALKIKLTADLGILDDVLDQFVKPTYIWYEAQHPYRWLQYQGFEKGAHSPYIISTLVIENPD